MRKIKIIASFTGTIPTGSYENEKPFYAVEEESEIEDDVMNQLVNEMINIRQKELHDICYSQFKRQAEVSYSERIAKQYQQIRFYDGKDGIKYPSVTSIMNWDIDFGIPQDELVQRAARGTIIHKLVEVFLKTGKWINPSELPELSKELTTVSAGSLNLSLDDTSFVNFFKDYPFKTLELEKTVLNHEQKYGGRLDIKCVIESTNKGKWDKIEGVIFDAPIILDVKTGTLDAESGIKQQTAYWHCEPDVMGVGLIHLNKENKCGYSKPIIETDKLRYWNTFLKERESFRRRFGV